MYAAKIVIDNDEEVVSRLKKEYRNLKHLKGCHVPKVYGVHKIEFNGVKYHLFIMQFLGPNLTQVFARFTQKFDIETTCRVGLKMI